MMNALSTRRVFRKLLVAALAAAVPIAAFAACSSGTGALAGVDGSAEGQQQCHAEKVDASMCSSFTVEILGDPATCGFAATDTGFASGSVATCNALCGRSSCFRSSTAVTCNGGCAVDGRRYFALDDTRAPVATDVGSYLARMAFFEAASVDAFALLGSALREHGAPAALSRSCDRARLDEIRHARMAARLARRHGAEVVPAPPAGSTRGSRASLEQLAIENAVEGCTRETFGVLLGMFQAEHAPTPGLRAFFAKLATDESRHAALAHRVDAWLRGQLSSAAQLRVDDARAEARRELRLELAAAAPDFARDLGLPAPAQAVALFDAWITLLDVDSQPCALARSA